MLMYPVSEGTVGLVNMQSFMKHVYGEVYSSTQTEKLATMN